MKTVGVLGGGQLGRMMAEPAARLGIKLFVLDPGANCPAAQLGAQQIVGNFKDVDEVAKLAEVCDILTVEIEHVNCDALEKAAKEKGVIVEPSPQAIRIIQDKFLQKEHLVKHGVPVVEYRAASGAEEVREAGKVFGYPLMLKSRVLAYDGRGNAVVKTADDVEAAIKSLVSDKLYVEKWCPFKKELAVMVVRARNGKVTSYPVVETIQKDNICHTVIAPAQVPGDVAEKARVAAENAISSLPGAGVYGVEMFYEEDGNVLLNEIAPRPHNSGHYTIEACHTSQFEQHLRAVCDMPLGSCGMRVPAAIMVNTLGAPGGLEETMVPVQRALTTDGASVHWYGKAESRPKRKMGHITVTANTMPEALNKAQSVMGYMTDAGALNPMVGVIMGSDSDLPIMRPCAEILKKFGVPFEVTIVSAHRTPQRMVEYAHAAHARGIKVIIAGAGGAAHLPGMTAALTPVPVIGVPVALKVLDGQDSLHSIVQMPRGVPVATVAINNSTNAALLALRIIGSFVPSVYAQLEQYHKDMEAGVHLKVKAMEEQGWEEYKGL